MLMTAHRYDQLKRGAPPKDLDEIAEFNRIQLQERRSEAAKRAVETKRRKYKKWPTRRGDHK